jgi:excisionase family DNA binding protein
VKKSVTRRDRVEQPTVIRVPAVQDGGGTTDNGAGQSEPLLYTAEQAAELLQVRPSWLRRKATARAVPCRFVGKHLRFSRTDLDAIAEAGATRPRPHHAPRHR